MIPPLNSDKSPQKLMRRSTWSLFWNWMVALSVRRPSGLHRICVEQQRRYFDPPQLSPDEDRHERGRLRPSKYG
jgi:hypothetical protein